MLKNLHRALSAPKGTAVVCPTLIINRASVFTNRLYIRLRRVMGFPSSLQLPNGGNIIAVDEAALVKDNVYWSGSAAARPAFSIPSGTTKTVSGIASSRI